MRTKVPGSRPNRGTSNRHSNWKKSTPSSSSTYSNGRAADVSRTVRRYRDSKSSPSLYGWGCVVSFRQDGSRSMFTGERRRILLPRTSLFQKLRWPRHRCLRRLRSRENHRPLRPMPPVRGFRSCWSILSQAW